MRKTLLDSEYAELNRAIAKVSKVASVRKFRGANTQAQVYKDLDRIREIQSQIDRAALFVSAAVGLLIEAADKLSSKNTA